MLCLLSVLQSAILSNVNNNITVKWTFIHTGGILLNSINNYTSTNEKPEDNGNSCEHTNTIMYFND